MKLTEAELAALANGEPEVVGETAPVAETVDDPKIITISDRAMELAREKPKRDRKVDQRSLSNRRVPCFF